MSSRIPPFLAAGHPTESCAGGGRPDGLDPGADPAVSSRASAAASALLSAASDPTCGTGVRWRRRNRPISPSTPPSSCTPSKPGAQKKLQLTIGCWQRPRTYEPSGFNLASNL